jgi:hypothetical protein
MKRRLIAPLFLLLGLLSGTVDAAGDELAKGFQNPPDAARPWVWWFWLNNNVSKQTITADLEELKAKGIGGVTVYSLAALQGPVASGPQFMSREWRDLFRHAVVEADRLGMGVSLIPCSGWNAGGPWLDADDACKKFVQSSITVTGPRKFAEKLPQPPTLQRYWDVNVQAFPAQPAPAQQDPVRQRLLAIKSAQDSAGDLPQTPVRQLCDVPQTPLKPIAGESSIDPGKVINLTAKLAADGTLTWDVPEGRWTILRTGCTLNGTRTQCGAPGNDGWDADPLRATAIENHFKKTTKILTGDVGKLAGKTFRTVQIDSWEINIPNWSQTFLKDFRRYRKYDAAPYLAALSGNIVGSAEITDRFLHDYRKTLADCVAKNYFGRFTALAHASNILNQSEAAGPCYPKTMPLDSLKNLGRCDIPMGEFWHAGGGWGENGPIINGKQTSSAAHLYGRPIAAAEAFTAFQQWMESPASLKPTADRGFCEGFNSLFIFSTATQQGDGTPGNEFHAGTHFNRKITWWNQARSFTDYLARCSYLLRQGLFVADACYYNGDGAPNLVEPKHVDPSLGAGYDYDVCNAEVLLTRMAVRDGRIVLPDGMSYRLLVLPERNAMPLEVLQKLRDLVAAGATVVGPKPERDAGLKNYPECDRQVRRLADMLWGDCNGKTVTEHRFGKGRIIWGKTLRAVLAADHVPTDFDYANSAAGAVIDFIHRNADGTEVYFVANRNGREESVDCTFRVDGKLPEFWDPVTGAMRKAERYTIADGCTTVPLQLAAYGSTFVVFREPASVVRATGINFGTLRAVQELAGPWTVAFDPKWGGPASIQFDRLVSWPARPEDGVKFYSGTAVYHRTFDLAEPHASGSRVYLDIGPAVRDVVEIRLNGKNLGVLWTAPWRIDITDAVKPTDNRLEIAVTNLWPNRLIGDAALPVEKRLTRTNIVFGKDHPLLESGLLGPVRILTAEKEKR